MTTSPVTVIGESVIDVIMNDSSTDIERRPGGSPMNVAVGLARMGISVELLTAIGSDDDGDLIRRHLAASGVQLGPGSTGARPTPTAIATIESNGAASYAFDLHWERTFTEVEAGPIVHTGSVASYRPPGDEALVNFISTISDHVVITYDPNIRPSFIDDPLAAHRQVNRFVNVASVVKLSDEDAQWLYPQTSPDAVIDRLLDSGPQIVALTQGDQGAIVATDSERVRVLSSATNVVDTVGAGDAFMASLISSVACDGISGAAASLRKVAEAAARAAGITVGRAGADLPWAANLAERD